MRMESKPHFQRFLIRCSVGLYLSLVHTNEYGHRAGSQPPLWLTDESCYWQEPLGLSQPTRSAFWFASKIDKSFPSEFTFCSFSFTTAEQLKRFLGCLEADPKPKSKAIFCL